MRDAQGPLALVVELLSKAKQYAISLIATIMTAAVGRRSDLWIFSSFQSAPQFSDNAKYLYLHLADDHPEMRAIWITDSPRVRDLLEAEGYDVEMRRSIGARYHALRAGFVVLDSGLDAVPWEYAGGAVKVQLTHGIPLKGPRRWTDRIPQEARSDPGRLQRLIDALSRRIYRVDYFCVPSEEAARQFARWVAASAHMGHIERSFPSSTLLIAGHPRTDIYHRQVPHADLGNPPDLHERLEHARDYDVVIGYFPTFREDRRSIEPFDVDRLTRFLEDRNAVLLVKPHRQMEVGLSGAGSSDHLCVLPPDADSATFLQRIDVLITDYSSIYFDYLHTGNPVVMYTFDREEYEEARGLLSNFDEVTAAAHHVRDSGALITCLEALLDGGTANPLAQECGRLKRRFFLHQDGRAADRIVSALTGEGDRGEWSMTSAEELLVDL